MPSWLDWNNAIGQAVFSQDHAGRVVYLAIDQEEIQTIGTDLGLTQADAFEAFRRMMREQIGRFSWPDAGLAGTYPKCLIYLTVQVIAAANMRAGEDLTSNAYWGRLREFLGQKRENKIPDGLTSEWHMNMWLGLARWANETNAGRLGRINLAAREGSRRLVVQPIGQCLLRRADLKLLHGRLFAEHDPGRRGRLRGAELRSLVDDALARLANKYFTQHGQRVLRDPDRSATARVQIVEEYERYLATNAPMSQAILTPPPVSRTDPAPSQSVRQRKVLLLQIGRGGLSGGLYCIRDGRRVPVIESIGAVLRRRQQPGGDRAVLATRLAGVGACFQGRQRCRVGDEILLFIPEGNEPGWPKALGPFQGELTCYRPLTAGERPGWRTLAGLPLGWVAIRGRIRDDLDGIALLGPWAARVDRFAANLRVAGGLLLRRRVWMLGAGPTIQVLGTSRFDSVLVDGERRPLDADRTATLNLSVGSHVVRLPGRVTGGVRFRIEAAERIGPVLAIGWRRFNDGWPASTAERRRLAPPEDGATLHGPALIGDWPPRPLPSPPGPPQSTTPIPLPSPPGLPRSTTPIELIALEVIRHLRLGTPPGPGPIARPVNLAWNSNHPLARALARAATHPPLGEKHARSSEVAHPRSS